MAVYNRYVRWGVRRIWRDVFGTLASEDEDDLDFIDSLIVKAHRVAAGLTKRNCQRVLGPHAAAG